MAAGRRFRAGGHDEQTAVVLGLDRKPQDGEQAAGQAGSGVSRSCRPRGPIQSASCRLGPYARWRLPSTAVRASHSATRTRGSAAACPDTRCGWGSAQSLRDAGATMAELMAAGDRGVSMADVPESRATSARRRRGSRGAPRARCRTRCRTRRRVCPQQACSSAGTPAGRSGRPGGSGCLGVDLDGEAAREQPDALDQALPAVRVVAPGAAVAAAEEGALHAARHEVVVAGVAGIDEQSSRGGHRGIVAVPRRRVDGRCPGVPCDIGPASPRFPGSAACEISYAV